MMENSFKGNKMLKKILLLFILLFFVFPVPGHSAQHNAELVILYTGDTKGNLDPCG